MLLLYNQFYALQSGLAKKEKVNLVGDDVREGLTCVLSNVQIKILG